MMEIEYQPINWYSKIFSYAGTLLFPQEILKKGKSYIVYVKIDDNEVANNINKFIDRVMLNCLFLSLFYIIIIIYLYTVL